QFYPLLYQHPLRNGYSALSLHDALPIFLAASLSMPFLILMTCLTLSPPIFSILPWSRKRTSTLRLTSLAVSTSRTWPSWNSESRSEEHTSELQSRENLVCRLLLEKTKRT